MALRQQFDIAKLVSKLEGIACCPLMVVEGMCTSTSEQATTLIFYTECGPWYRTFYNARYRNKNYLWMELVNLVVWFKECQTV